MKKIVSVLGYLVFLAFIKTSIAKNLLVRGQVGGTIAAEELILKVKENPQIAGWVYQKGKLENSYCLYERKYLILARANVDITVQTPILNVFKEHEANILASSFSISNKRFVSLDADGFLVERTFANWDEVNVRKVHEKLKPTSVAISPDDTLELVGFKNGFIQANSLLKKTNKNIDVYFKAHEGSVYSISFNALGNYFISSGTDGKIKIWNAKDLLLLHEIDTFINTPDLIPVPALFSPLNDIAVYATGKETLCFQDIQGNTISTVFVPSGIKTVHFTEKKDLIAVLTSENTLEFYSIRKGKYQGTLTSLKDISSFSVNIVTGNILVATKDGKIYLCTPKEIKNEKPAKTNPKEETKKTAKDDANKRVEEAAQIQNNPIEDEENPKLSKTTLRYWGLEDDVSVKKTSRKPSFLLKDETPLAPIFIFSPFESTKNAEMSEKSIEETSNKTDFTSNQTDFDEETDEPEPPIIPYTRKRAEYDGDDYDVSEDDAVQLENQTR